jgi:hypothetical protein
MECRRIHSESILNIFVAFYLNVMARHDAATASPIADEEIDLPDAVGTPRKGPRVRPEPQRRPFMPKNKKGVSEYILNTF